MTRIGFVAAFLLIGTVAASAALPPYWQRKAEIDAIADSSDVARRLEKHGPIDAIELVGNDHYRVRRRRLHARGVYRRRLERRTDARDRASSSCRWASSSANELPEPFADSSDLARGLDSGRLPSVQENRRLSPCLPGRTSKQPCTGWRALRGLSTEIPLQPVRFTQTQSSWRMSRPYGDRSRMNSGVGRFASQRSPLRAGYATSPTFLCFMAIAVFLVVLRSLGLTAQWLMRTIL